MINELPQARLFSLALACVLGGVLLSCKAQPTVVISSDEAAEIRIDGQLEGRVEPGKAISFKLAEEAYVIEALSSLGAVNETIDLRGAEKKIVTFDFSDQRKAAIRRNRLSFVGDYRLSAPEHLERSEFSSLFGRSFDPESWILQVSSEQATLRYSTGASSRYDVEYLAHGGGLISDGVLTVMLKRDDYDIGSSAPEHLQLAIRKDPDQGFTLNGIWRLDKSV